MMNLPCIGSRLLVIDAMELGLSVQYYRLHTLKTVFEAEDCVPRCRTHGCSFPAGGRSLPDLTPHYRRWFLMLNEGNKEQAEDILRLSCCANCARDSLWNDRREHYPERRDHGRHCTGRLQATPRPCKSLMRETLAPYSATCSEGRGMSGHTVEPTVSCA